MQPRLEPPKGRSLRIAAVLGGTALLLWRFRSVAGHVAALVLGASALAFLAEPLAKRFERRLSRPAAALAALSCLIAVIALAAALLLPAMLRELIDLSRTLPDLLGRLSGWLEGASAWVLARVPGLALPKAALPNLDGAFSAIASGAYSTVAGAAALAGNASLAVVLAWFFLRDRESLLLRLELLLPQAVRGIAVRMGNAVLRELRLYLGGQALIALSVSALAALLLSVLGVRSALVLGPVIGILNMIPYVGPLLGGVPAVLIALGDGWRRALLTAAALALVQQLDGAVISPRIMGSVTGLSPAAVLIGVFAGARAAGIVGMLLALPMMLTIRTLFRVFVQRYENI